MKPKTELLKGLFEQWSGHACTDMVPLARTGSDRQYFRMTASGLSAIGVYSPDRHESEAYLSFSRHLKSQGVRVPALYAYSDSTAYYLMQDLGGSSLLDLMCLPQGRQRGSEAAKQYEKVVSVLPYLQCVAGQGLDYSLCYPSAEFDRRGMMWDLNYFKYCFLKPLNIHFDEAQLEDDFENLSTFLDSAEKDTFMYRDLQARNILVHEGEPWFIDFQGGRRGPLQYDLASLLFQVKAQLPPELREHLLAMYLLELQKYKAVDGKEFRRLFDGFVLHRLLQVLGAYGFRGYFERKAHFITSVPLAVEQLGWLKSHTGALGPFPELGSLVDRLGTMQFPGDLGLAHGKLKVEVNSFSYKHQIPADYSGHGGGFVFDCRALPNPGRLPQYRQLTGKDEAVIGYLESHAETGPFFEQAMAMVDMAVNNYVKRGFDRLQVNFGCTGGQHRSVYMAGRMAAHLRMHEGVEVELHHREMGELS